MTTTDDTQQDALEPQTPAEPPEGGTERSEPAAEGDTTGEPPDDAEDEHPSAREAAKWRKKFRDLEAEHQVLGERLEATQRQMVESQAEAHGLKAKALWATAELTDLLDADGVVDVGRVHEAVRAAADELGVQIGLYVPGEGHQPGVPAGNNWAAAFAPPARR